MGRLNNPIKRISKILDEEIKKIATKNKISYTRACEKMAEVSMRNRNKKIKLTEEIKF